MSSTIVLILISSLILANLPWLSERFFILFSPPFGGVKRTWMRLTEWLVFAVLTLLFASGLEQKITGSIHSQDWEFYAVFMSLFFVFAFPSFFFRHLVSPLFHRKSL